MPDTGADVEGDASPGKRDHFVIAVSSACVWSGAAKKKVFSSTCQQIPRFARAIQLSFRLAEKDATIWMEPGKRRMRLLTFRKSHLSAHEDDLSFISHPATICRK